MAGDGVDWGDGDYARTARFLEPAAGEVLDAVGAGAGDALLDVACGTGNVALAAAARGARVVGVDGAEALLVQARERAAAAGADVELRAGDVGALPVADGAFDAVVSVFGVIFAPDADRACAELVRALRPGGRLALTSWVPEGGIATAGRLLLEALPPVAEPPAEPRRWGDAAWVRERLAGAGARDVAVAERGLAFTAASPAAWFAEQEEHHPIWRWGRRTLDDAAWARLREATVRALTERSEDPDGFRSTSRYLLVTARR
jgi:SAM-dependent methyltransferase